MPSECGSFGRGDFRPATVVVRRKDGAAMSRFRYVSHKIVKGALHLQGMPCARKADETLILTLKDDFSDIELDLNYSVSEDSDVLVRSAVVAQRGKDAAELAKAFSFCTELPDNRGSIPRAAARGGVGAGKNARRNAACRGNAAHRVCPRIFFAPDETRFWRCCRRAAGKRAGSVTASISCTAARLP